MVTFVDKLAMKSNTQTSGKEGKGKIMTGKEEEGKRGQDLTPTENKPDIADTFQPFTWLDFFVMADSYMSGFLESLGNQLKLSDVEELKFYFFCLFSMKYVSRMN